MLDSLVDLQLHVSGWIVPIPDNLGGGGGRGQYITRPQHYCYNNSYSPDIPTIYNNISHITFLLFAYVDNYWFMLPLYFLSNNTRIGADAQRLRQGTGTNRPGSDV